MSPQKKKPSQKKGKANEIDAEVGKQLKRLRIVSGLSQEELAARVQITFQQIQKYENGANRISASRLYEFSKILDTPVEFFFSTWNAQSKKNEGNSEFNIDDDVMTQKETLDLVHVYYSLKSPGLRKNFLKLFKAIVKNYN